MYATYNIAQDRLEVMQHGTYEYSMLRAIYSSYLSINLVVPSKFSPDWIIFSPNVKGIDSLNADQNGQTNR